MERSLRKIMKRTVSRTVAGLSGLKVLVWASAAFAAMATTALAKDLDITDVSDVAVAVEPGSIITYTIVVTNSAAVPHSNVTVSDVVPAGTTNVPGSVQATLDPAAVSPGPTWPGPTR